MSNLEIWKNIKNYEGLYMVSNFGRISNSKGLRKLVESGIGYKKIKLSKNGVQKTFLVHRLVAEAFIPNSENKSQVNHIDMNRGNNHVENLEWCTNKENCIHGLLNNKNRISISGSKNYLSKLNEVKVKEMRILSKEGMTDLQLSERFGVCRRTIWAIVRNKSWKHVI